MSAPKDIGNRHLLPAEGVAPAPDSKPFRVRILVSKTWAQSVAGQLLASCLVNLLCRQAGIIEHVQVVSNEVPLLIGLPSDKTELSFPRCLVGMAKWAVGDAIKVSCEVAEHEVDYTIAIGDAVPAAPGRVFHAIGDGWRAWIGRETSTVPADCIPTSNNPLGPFLAAALISAELFKINRGILRGKYLDAVGFSLWDAQYGVHWSDLADGPELVGRILPPVHVVGAGAVGNAFAYIVANARFMDSYLCHIDDDKYDDTNLNRCLLAGWRDVDHDKVEAIDRALRTAGVGSFPFNKAISAYLVEAKPTLRADLAREADNVDLNIVLSCVDKGTSRQSIQGLRARHVIGGSTLDLRAQANIYNLWPGSACLGCYNLQERDGDKVRALERQLRNMSPQERVQFLTDRGLDAESIEQYLADPQCGSVGEAALKDFATQPSASFSVGFASLGAALLMASALFRRVLFRDVSREPADMTTLNFLNGGFAESGLGADPRCELQCTTTRRVAQPD